MVKARATHESWNKRDDEEIHGKEIIFHCKRDKLN
jgi:hypothetical protein